MLEAKLQSTTCFFIFQFAIAGSPSKRFRLNPTAQGSRTAIDLDEEDAAAAKSMPKAKANGSIFLRLGFISRQMAHRIMNWHSITAYAEYAGWAAAGLLTLLALTAILVVIIKGRRRTSQARAARALLGAEQIDQTPVHSSCTSMASDHTSILQSEPALAFSPKVPRGIRVMYPVFAVLCFWLYIWADLSVAAEVNADLEVAGAPQGDWEWSGTMSTLTLIPAAKDAWNSGAKATAILLGLLNGVWPFCQTLVLLVVWFLPGSWLFFLEVICSTWKIGPIFSMPYHHLGCSLSASLAGPPDFNMALESGLFAFLLAAVLTNALGYLADHYHFLSANAAAELPWARNVHPTCRVPLSSFSKSRHWPTVLCPLVAVATAASSVVKAFSVSLISAGTSSMLTHEPKYIRSYSLLSFGLRLVDANQEAGIYERLFQIVFLATSLVVPLLLSGVLLTVWIVPLKPQAQNGLLRLGHALDAWIALDVFVVVVAICSLDFGRMTWYAAHQGPMQEACRWMRRELSVNACVQADVKLEKGFVMLAAAAAALLLVPKVALRACRRAVAKRDQLNSRAWASSVLASTGHGLQTES
eukprot:symbB.v1.2.031424.t1/scaffold3635.1/size52935/2